MTTAYKNWYFRPGVETQLAEIESIKHRLQREYELGRVSEKHLVATMHLLGNHEAFYADVENEHLEESTTNRNTRTSFTATEAKKHGMTIARGKHWLKIQRQLPQYSCKTLTTKGA
jgi:hypothetical protein